MAVATLQPCSADSYTNHPDNPTGNFGSSTSFSCGENKDYPLQQYRALLKWDALSDGTIPPGSIINSAILSLKISSDKSTNTRTKRVFRLKRAWVESQVTANIWKAGSNWSSVGAFGADDCEQTDIGSTSFTGSEPVGTWKSFTLTASKIQEMISGGTWTNNGFLIKTDTETSDSYSFYSSEYATSADRPKLVIDYSPQGGNKAMTVMMFKKWNELHDSWQKKGGLWMPRKKNKLGLVTI